MTTTLVPPESSASAARALRVPPFAANLLPAEVVEARQTRRIKRLVASALAGTLAIIAAWYGAAYVQTSMARSDLTDAETRIESMNRQHKEFDELVQIQAESKAINAQLSVLLTNDLQWAGLFAAVRAAAPAGIQVTGLAATVAGTGAQTGRPAGGGLPNSGPDKLIGRLTVTGTGPSKPTVAAFVDAVGRVTGLANPLLSSADQDGNMVRFTLDLDITGAALGGRFTPKAGN